MSDITPSKLTLEDFLGIAKRLTPEQVAKLKAAGILNDDETTNEAAFNPKRGRYGGVTVEFNGKPFVVEVDTFDHTDCFGGYFDTEAEAIEAAQKRGGTMHVCHAYNAEGRHIGQGGTF